MTGDDDRVERLAKAMFETHNNVVTWERVNEHIKRQYRRFAVTAIRVLRG